MVRGTTMNQKDVTTIFLDNSSINYFCFDSSTNVFMARLIKVFFLDFQKHRHSLVFLLGLVKGRL